MADTTGRIPLWLLGTVDGILVIGFNRHFILCLLFWIGLIPLVVG